MSWCEKPMAVTYDECQAMVKCRKRDREVSDDRPAGASVPHPRKGQRDPSERCHWKRFKLPHQFPPPVPKTGPLTVKKSGSLTKDPPPSAPWLIWGYIKADLIHYLLDDVIESAMAVTETLDKKNPDGTPIDVDDNAVCIFRTQKGVIGTMEVSWTCYGQEDKSTIIYGTNGSLKINCDPQYPIILEKKSGEQIYFDMKNYHSSQNGSGIIDTWMTCLTTNTPPLISGASSFESMKAVFAALESAEKGVL